MGEDTRWQRIRRILEEALDLPLDDRLRFVQARCADAGVESHEVLSLLALAGVDVGTDAKPGELARFLSDHRLVNRAVEHLAHGDPPKSSPRVEAEIARLQQPESAALRYSDAEEIGRGGMGSVMRVRDTHLQRDVAMKVLLNRATGGSASASSSGSSPDTSLLARFLDEAWISGQLEHPGIVPVHDLGIDHEGRVWFTMRLVRGTTLADVFLQHHSDPPSWPLPRIVNLLLKACEAIAFAHAKGVVHRDLKPSNIMVGRFGEVYVMDWGLAKAKGRPDHRDLRPRTEVPKLSSLKSLRKAELAATPDSPLVTMDGAVVGTPAYMAPEQAKGLVERVGVQSDVYAMGAILYELLTGQMPYVEPGARISPHTVLAMVIAGPPTDPDRLAPDTPTELAAICRKAMARDPESRYADMLAMSEDLRAFLEQRVVTAYRTGAIAEFRSWVRRNRGTAIAAAAAIVLAVAGSVGVSVVQSRARTESELRFAEIRRLSDVKILADLREQERSVGPDLPAGVSSLRGWILRAQDLADRLALHEGALARVRARALPYDEEAAGRDRSTHPDFETLQFEEQEREKVFARDPLDASLPARDARIADLKERVRERRTFEFANPEDAWEHDVLRELVDWIPVLKATKKTMESRLRDAESIESRSIEAHRTDWEGALNAIASIESPYDGRGPTRPQVGLVPLGPDPITGFQEFGHLQTGSLPLRDENGRLLITEESGLVFVLLPAGEFDMGSMRPNASAPLGSPNVDPESNESLEAPILRVALDGFFLSKYEMTQAQWVRARGKNLSKYSQLGGLHPVERVSHDESRLLLERFGLLLPTEAQWEYAARAGNGTVFVSGDSIEDLAGFANLADQAALRAGIASMGAIETLDDGFAEHAPVGSFRANGFGLHDMCGNVWEWCRDPLVRYTLTPRAGDGLRSLPTLPAQTEFVTRGAGYLNITFDARVARRAGSTPDKRGGDAQGVRPARAIDR